METQVQKHPSLNGGGAEGGVSLSVIIVSYNVSGFLDHCLDSVIKACTGIRAEIIVVDNASTDTTVEMVRNKYPGVALIENPRNVGYSAANNQGITRARGAYSLLLNPDTIVPSNACTLSIDFLEKHPDIGLMSLKIVNADGTFQPACRRGFPTPTTAFYRMTGLSHLFPRSSRFGKYNLTFLDEDAESDVDAVCGAYMMVRTSLLKDIGGFDEDFFMYGEDIDLCYKIKERGSRVYYYPASEIIHFKGESSRKNRLQSALNFYNSMFIFSKKHFGQRMSFFPKWLLFLGIFLNAFFKIIGGWLFKYLPFLIDIVIVNAVLFAALNIKFGSEGNVYKYTEGVWYIMLHCGISLLFVLTFQFSGLYGGKPKTLSEYAKAIFVASLLFFSFAYFIPNIRYSRIAFITTSLGLFAALPAWRILLYPTALKMRTAIARTRKHLIIGTGEKAFRIHQKLQKDREYQSCFAGFVKNDEPITGVPAEAVIGPLSEIELIIEKKKIREVFLALPDHHSFDLMGFINYCLRNNIYLKIVQDMHGKDEYYILDINMSESIIL
ncbi:MAG: hypothetical protein A2248_17590 [Candidatus Raymondbacteria bacterium RIFOXYA2_FULL_49_16]|uniref:Uncharacterized protein n=1 Tax=Candidatus Raymondbacteria bacterium RIFOXYD12_FULL_49_13 TaxID=1817890 RepID=A0A1F7F6U8_UNCRA|nr:MAG: hypothetical protein A2248_17590 [Candidatus Raymondbacteria bacterium RIFOXYA2_FULL_49_16]OGK02292.1 MAG: hypothetical protein A2519_16615 [Candidatus Raymondbacteria bacterium RIFOXYD12_FULL_49_13]OGP44907.1 MAG: hypothetical protein A2324_19515 [Candidatus Raymondbacteria bacterium RIFOXYB2_FULL_49_35]